jgi:pyridoxal phosphate enzyme (YggS family)
LSAGAGGLEDEIRERAERLLGRVHAACARAGRSPDDVTLVGASKGQPADRLVAAVRAGVLQLGENYVNEAQAKRPQVEASLAACDHPAQVVWRMIGGLQRNKARVAVDLFDSIDSVDREPLAVELDRRSSAFERRLDVCLQVNLSEEPQKSGVAPEHVQELLRSCASLPHLRVTGLMTVPAAASDPEQARPTFARLRELRDTLQSSEGGGELRELSMGMSGDFETAIEEGSTLVRVGTALFGPRAA